MDRKKLAIVHIVKKELNLSDKEYRDILQQATGMSSARDLDEEKFKKLIKFFVRSGYYRLNPQGLTIKQKLYIKFLYKHLGWTKEHLSNFIHKYYHKSSIDKLTRKEAIKAIESLKNIKLHQK